MGKYSVVCYLTTKDENFTPLRALVVGLADRLTGMSSMPKKYNKEASKHDACYDLLFC